MMNMLRHHSRKNKVLMIFTFVNLSAFTYYSIAPFASEIRTLHEKIHNLNETGVRKKRSPIFSDELDNKDVAPSSKSSLSRPVCNRTRHLFHSMDAVEAAYQQLESFHNRGGNIKTIETYLNDHMDSTLNRLKITFTPDGDGDGDDDESEQLSPETSISQEIMHLLAKHDEHNRGGYDQRKMPGHYNSRPATSNFLEGNPKDNRVVFDVLEPTEDFKRWKEGLGPIPDLCHHLDYIKPQGDSKRQSSEEKFMCSLPLKKDENNSPTHNIEKKKAATIPPSASASSCELISIGCNGEWGFEKNIAATTNCQTHTFDCTLPNHEPHKPNITTIHFYPTCIAHEYKRIKKRKMEYLTYAQTVERAGLTDSPTLLKMDVEGFEYDVLTQMIVDANVHNGDSDNRHNSDKNKTDMLPLQISVELHYATRMYDLPWMPRMRTAAEIALFFRDDV